MGKNYDRGMGRSSKMHDTQIAKIEKKMFFGAQEEKVQTPVITKPAWSPERWAHKVTK